MAKAKPTTQAEIIAVLSDPASYHGHPPVERVDTHAARIFLAGPEAIKIKRPVRYSYLDFSTPERRRQALQRELEINRPEAPEIYRDLVAIVRKPDGSLALGGEGTPVDWALRMHRFDGELLLSKLAESGPLGDELIVTLAQRVDAYHRRAVAQRVVGLGAAAMSAILEELSTELGRLADGPTLAPLLAACSRALEVARDVLDARAHVGFVRRCHGDLHLGNIVVIDDRPVLFDALEFDERLATIDTLYDLAFLVMDLDHRGQRAAANLLLNRYLIENGDDAGIAGLAALPLFLALRAAIRGMTELQRGGPKSLERGRSYLDAAASYAAPTAPRLVAVGGFSGTGKSTLAHALAPKLGPAPGALHLRSDVERKRLLGTPEQERLPPETYTPAMSDRVYARLLDKAQLALRAGHAVVLDAVYSTPEERTAVEALAAALAVPFTGLWLAAAPDILDARVTARRGDASDADAAVVSAQVARGAGIIDWPQIDAGSSPSATLDAACAVLGLELGSHA